jgi:hypothetical protein
VKTRPFSKAASSLALLCCALGVAVTAAVPAAADEHNGQYTVKGPWKSESQGDSVAHCNRGDSVVGGGYEADAGSSSYVDSGPTTDATGWWAAVHITSSGKVRVYLLCQKAAK